MKKLRRLVVYLALCAVLSSCGSNESISNNQKQEELQASNQEVNDVVINKSSITDELEETVEQSSDAESIEKSNITNGKSPEELKGRGRSDRGRDEPEYIDVEGYIVVSINEELSLRKTDDFLNTPWVIETYEKDKQFFAVNGVVEHKTRVVVKSQELKHEGHGLYSGYLLVERVDNGEQFYINVSNFITQKYWEYTDSRKAASVGTYIAEFNQLSDYYPVFGNKNEKVELNDGINVLVIGTRNDKTNPIEAVVFKEWTYAYGGVSVFFNPEDLTIIY